MNGYIWLVWREDGGAPTFKHPDYESATREAKRLARENAGSKFMVLVAVSSYSKVDVTETVFIDPMNMDIPF